mgnify:CR=1 FL=1
MYLGKKSLLLLLAALILTTTVFAVPSAVAQRAETVIEDLDTVWELVWGPEGKLYITERRGNILVWDGEELTQLAEISVVERGESGLMGMALDPRFSENNFMYVCYTTRRQGELENVVERLQVNEEGISDRRMLLEGMRASFIHDGCRLKFAPDETLLITMGDSAQESLAQDKDSLNGKVLRITRDGDIPEDNPFPSSPVFTLGHRNPQGLDIRPSTGEIYISEHGPASNDEINGLVPGQNYGWPEVGGKVKTPEYHPALWAWTPTIAPAGISFLDSTHLYLATLKQSKLHRLTLNESGEITRDEIVLEGYGRLRALTQGPDGRCLYIGTSNRDGRGSPRSGDDRVLRYCPENRE